MKLRYEPSIGMQKSKRRFLRNPIFFRLSKFFKSILEILTRKKVRYLFSEEEIYICPPLVNFGKPSKSFWRSK